MMRRFKSDAEVQKYFALQAELRSTPEPPADLWERIEMARRAAKKICARKYHALNQPDMTALVFPEIRCAQKRYPIRSVERLSAVPDVPPPRRKTHVLKEVP